MDLPAIGIVSRSARIVAVVICPSCAVEMPALTLEGQLETQIDLNVCRGCQVIWFDRYESLRLSPGSTLQLFRLIGEGRRARPAPPREPMKCPRCGIRLLITHDRQRNTPFVYWRCGRDHGKLITFFDFLREKDFIRPLSPAQLADLRRNVQTVGCSNCGAPIDLGRDTVCRHCGTPLSTLDLKQIGEMAERLRAADDRHARPALDVDSLFELLRAERDRPHGDASAGLVEAGLQRVARWLSSTE